MNWPESFINKIICGDCLEVMKDMPDGSVDMILTSPPYWGLRDYGIEQIFGEDPGCKHKWDEIIEKAEGYTGKKRWQHGINREEDPEKWDKQIKKYNICKKCDAWRGQLGLEPTPEMYIEHLTEMLSEAKRVLKKKGTLWLNMGDTYWSAKGSCFNPGGGKTSLESPRKEKKIYPLERGNKSDVPNLPQKCLAMIPERLAWSLIQDDWILRNKIIWFKPNSMPSSTKDRFSNRWEYMFLFSKNQRYYFDLDAVREPHLLDSIEGKKRGVGPDHKYADKPKYGGGGGLNKPRVSLKDKRKGLNVPGQLPHGMHRKRHSGYFGEDGEYLVNPLGKNPGDHWKISTVGFPDAHFAVFPEKLCEKPIKAGCPEGGIVLDPFAGAGTVLYVAKQLRRRFIGIDIKKEYCNLCEKRLAQGVL